MSAPARTKQGTFQKGTSGNPSGRPKSEHAILRQRLAEHGEKVAAVVVEAALQGDIQAAEIVLDRICPILKPTAQPVIIDLPDTPGLVDTARAIIDHAAGGAIPPDVAGQLVQAVAALARVIEIDDIERRLTALEQLEDTKP